MLLEMRVPSPGESISEVEIAEWLVEDGDYVGKDQAIAEIDSDKATLELPAEESGTIKIIVGEGETVAVGDIVCIIDTSAKGETNVKSTKEEITETPKAAIKSEADLGGAKATPLASAIISEHDISPKQLKGTGKKGKITKSDVLDVIKTTSTDGQRGKSSKKMSSLRRKIASRLVVVKNETAMLTTFNEVDMSKVIQMKNDYKNEFIKKYSTKLGFMSFFVKACVAALKNYPAINAEIQGDSIVYKNYYNISFAVGTDKGLVVPVLRSPDEMSFAEIEKNILSLGEKARDGKISIEDLQGGTFTITNGGIYGSMLSTPILNPPQSGVLGMHNIIERAVVKDGQIIIRPMMYLALSYDHRIVDGKEAVSFLKNIKDSLEEPQRLFLNV